MMTDNQKAVYDFIVRFKQRHQGNSPTFKEIKIGSGINSNSSIYMILDDLEASGHIFREARESGAKMRITLPGWKMLFVPIPTKPEGIKI